MNARSSAIALALAIAVSGCSTAGGGVPVAGASASTTLSSARDAAQARDLATYYFYCSGIGLGTITAVVTANSQDDAFHVTAVAGGNGTVKAGDMLLVYAYTPPDKWPSSNPGFEKNGQTTYTCPSFSGRRQIYGTVSFVVRGAQNAPRTASALVPSNPILSTSYFYCSDIGLGTIAAGLVASSKGDAFHVTSVAGGNGTVKPGDILLAIAYENSQVTHSNPGFEKNGLTTYTCPSFSGRRQVYGTVTFVVRGTP